jgi:hypothetical protein
MAPQIETEELLTSQKSDIYVIPNPDPAGKFLVVPGTFGVPEDGKRIWVRNLTERPVEVTFPSSIGNGPPPAVIPAGTPRPFDLRKAQVGVYDYKVDVVTATGTKVPAEGGSNPRIVYG